MLSQQLALRFSDRQEIRRDRAQRSPFGRLSHAVFEIDPPESALQEALKKFNPQVSDPSPEMLAHVARAYRLDRIQFPSPEDKQWLLVERVERDIMDILVKHGYDHFSLDVRDGQNFLEVSCTPGHETLPLPPWLRIPYIVRETQLHVPFATNPKIGSGARIKDTSGRHIGTLGAIMCSSREDRSELMYIAITAGHVIPDNDTHVLVYNDATGEDISLKVSSSSYRSDGKRLCGNAQQPELSSEGCDEIALLIVPSDAIKYFSVDAYNVNVHYFNMDSGKMKPEEKKNPVVNSRYQHIERKLRLTPIMVFKKGSETDLTMGRLVGIEKDPPPGWYGQGEEIEILFGYGPEDEERDSECQNLAPSAVSSLSPTSFQSCSSPSEGSSNSQCFSGPSSSSSWSGTGSSEAGDLEERVVGTWFGKVQWSDKHSEFGAPGDSGSLVYAIESGTYVPLGIYLGTPESWRAQNPEQISCSCFISLETFAYGGWLEGMELVFPPA